MTNKQIFSTYEKLNELQTEINALTKQADNYKKMLAVAIPPNDTRAGVKHTVSLGKSVSWARVNEQARNLIPKTKQTELESIIAEHTKTTERHTYKAAE